MPILRTETNQPLLTYECSYVIHLYLLSLYSLQQVQLGHQGHLSRTAMALEDAKSEGKPSVC
jgi:hypothetical protein